MTVTPELLDQARTTAAAFNKAIGQTLLRVIDPPPELVSVGELQELANTNPGDYLAASAFQAIKGRKPTHAESIKLGHLLGVLMVARKKNGPYTLWRLDKAFAERAK